MKKIFLHLIFVLIIAGTALIGCKSEAEKTANLQAEMRLKSINNYLKFKKESAQRIIKHEKSIAEFKIRLAKENKENRKRDESKLAVLEQKNKDLKNKLEDYQEAGKDQWISFRSDFNREMNQLGNALKNFYYQ